MGGGCWVVGGGWRVAGGGWWVAGGGWWREVGGGGWGVSGGWWVVGGGWWVAGGGWREEFGTPLMLMMLGPGAEQGCGQNPSIGIGSPPGPADAHDARSWGPQA